MKRVLPKDIYRGHPCSVVAVGCALGVGVRDDLFSDELKSDGYLSLKSMNSLIRSKLKVVKRVNFKRGERPILCEWAHENFGKKAIICLEGHFIYFDGEDYYSFFWNGSDKIVTVWYIE